MNTTKIQSKKKKKTVQQNNNVTNTNNIEFTAGRHPAASQNVK
jgi:hypothetical protein